MDLKEASRYRIIEKHKKGETNFFIQTKIFDKWFFIRDKRGSFCFIGLFIGIIFFFLWADTGFSIADNNNKAVLYFVAFLILCIGSLLWMLMDYLEFPRFKKIAFEDYRSAEDYVKEIVAEKETKKQHKEEGEYVKIHMLDIRIERREKLDKLNNI
jgi:hypothetical protein